MRKKTSKARATTEPVSVTFKRGVREALARLVAVRKLNANATEEPASVIGIVDQAILDFADYLKTADEAAFLPVPASECVRVSLRVTDRVFVVGQRVAAKHDVRITDFFRTALTRYIRKHEKEITSYRPVARRKALR